MTDTQLKIKRNNICLTGYNYCDPTKTITI